ncbi:hypothetical protein [Haladaptatus salinisoli]|uniref:hypothetical protein n=1 Tax=Haladaptatus salinisoli TaxID=2884876 RepID=UPI001D0B8BCC|nr:hypothetical protein [Haladaptatus salinisoli]
MARQYQQPQQYQQHGHHQRTGESQGRQFGHQAGGQQMGGQQMGGQQMGGQQGGGQQMGQRSMQESMGGQSTGQQSGQQQILAYDEMLPNDMRTALHDFSRLKKSCEWAAEQIHGQIPGETEIPRALEDLAEIAELNEKLIVRDSRHGPYLAQTFVEVAQDDIQQLQQAAQQQPMLTPVVSDLQRAVNSTTQMLDSIGWQGGQQSMGQQMGGQQSTSQQSQMGQQSGRGQL